MRVWRGGWGVCGGVWGRGVIGASFPPTADGGTNEVVVQVRDGARSSFRPSPASFPPTAAGGTREVVVQVRDGARSSFCLSPASFPPTTDGGTNEVVVQVRDGARSSFCPSPASFPPTADGGTREVVVQVRDGARSSFRPSPVSFPPPVVGGTSGGVSGRARVASRGRLRSVVIVCYAVHLDLSVGGGVPRCEPHTCCQAPPVPAVLSSEESASV